MGKFKIMPDLGKKKRALVLRAEERRKRSESCGLDRGVQEAALDQLTGR